MIEEPEVPFSLAKLTVPVATVLAAAVGALVTWLTYRTVGKAAFQQAINDGFKGLVDRLKEQEASCREELAELKDEFENAKRAAALRDVSFRGAIVNLQQTIASLVALLRQNGIALPDAVNVDPQPYLLLADDQALMFQGAKTDGDESQ